MISESRSSLQARTEDLRPLYYPFEPHRPNFKTNFDVQSL